MLLLHLLWDNKVTVKYNVSYSASQKETRYLKNGIIHLNVNMITTMFVYLYIKGIITN